MGSEMCIRDRKNTVAASIAAVTIQNDIPVISLVLRSEAKAGSATTPASVNKNFIYNSLYK